jgi:hypothetical protein
MIKEELLKAKVWVSATDFPFPLEFSKLSSKMHLKALSRVFINVYGENV